MTKLGKLCMVIVLALALAPSAFAGITDTPPAAPPQPPSITATGIIGTPPSAVTAAPNASTDPAIDIALALLQSALSLF